eukprot:3400411-Rhodomonas_salina.2
MRFPTTVPYGSVRPRTVLRAPPYCPTGYHCARPGTDRAYAGTERVQTLCTAPPRRLLHFSLLRSVPGSSP